MTAASSQPLNLEDRLALINAGFFLREFSFSKTHFSPPGGSEVELADHVVSFDDVLMVFQIKQRTDTTEDPVQEASWFEKKVIRKATKQVRDTLAYLGSHRIVLGNDQGHSVALPQELQGLRLIKIIVYEPGRALPTNLRHHKGYAGSSAGFIHTIHAEDYEIVLQTLVTLPEVVEYFTYREAVGLCYPEQANAAREQAMLGQFLAEEEIVLPSSVWEVHLTALQDDRQQFEFFGILHRFKERTYRTSMTGPNDGNILPWYYDILKELLRLPRTDLAEFKKRFLWAWDRCGGDEVELPSLFVSMQTGCGFVFIPLREDAAAHKETALINFTMAAKYDLQVERCLGLIFLRDGTYRLVDWMLRSHPWERDEELEAKLQESYPFRTRRLEYVPRYRFDVPWGPLRKRKIKHAKPFSWS